MRNLRVDLRRAEVAASDSRVRAEPSYLRFGLLLLAASPSTVGGCGGDAAESFDSYWDTAGPMADGGVDAGLDAGADADAGRECPVLDPSVDSDQDGLLDVVEDANRDCVVGYGETDPYAEDTDRDGLTDGDEDLDRDGVYEPESGEFDPRTADSDQDGTRDALEPQAVACRALLGDSEGTLHVVGEAGVVYAIGADEVLPTSDGLGAVVVVDAGASVSVVYPRIQIALAPSDAAASIAPAVELLGGSVRTATDVFAAGTGRAVSELTIEVDRPLAVADLVAALGELPVGLLPVPDAASTSVSDRFVVRIEADVGEYGTVDGRLIATIWPQMRGPMESVPRVFALSSVAGSAASRVTPVCGERVVESGGDVGLIVVVDPGLARGPAVDAVIGTLDQVVSRRRESGANTRVWMVAADAVDADAALGEVELRDRDALRTAAAALVDSPFDPAPWSAALTALDAVGRSAPGLALVVIPVVGAEDPSVLGEPIAGVAPACSTDADAASCAGEIAERIRSAGADLVAIAPKPTADPSTCGVIAGGRVPGGFVEGVTSFWTVASAVGGAHVDLCNADAASVSLRLLVDRLPVGRTVSLGDGAIVPTAIVVDPSTLERVQEIHDLGISWPGRVAFSDVAGDGAVGVSYLRWEL